MKKYDSIPRLGKATGIFGDGELFIQEKIDGANFRFRLNRDGKISFGTKNIDYGPVEPDPKPTSMERVNDRLYDVTRGFLGEEWKPYENVDKSFLHAIRHVHARVEPQRIRTVQEAFADGDRLMFFGEATHKHIMEYEDIPSFLGFDVYNLDKEKYIHPNEAELLFDEIGLETVPMVERGIEATSFSAETFEFPDSEYLPDDHPDDSPRIEGVVIKNPEINKRAKIRTKRFKEVHNGNGKVESDRNDPPNDLYGKTAAQHNSVAFAQKYATPARIRKHILKLHDQGHDIEMPMMEDLWRAVAEDIVDEEGDEILLSGNKTLNTRDFRSEVASRCAHTLEQFIDQRGRNPEADPEDISTPNTDPVTA